MTVVRRISAARAKVSAVGRAGRGRSAAAWTLVISSGALQVAARRFYVNPDGVSYLNLSDAYTRGDWAGAVNTYWSPLYPFIIGATRRVFPWPMYWESSITHLINLSIYLASYACFRMMLREVTAYQREKQAADPKSYYIDWAGSWEFALAHVLFLWSALILINLRLVTPDMLLAAEVYLIVLLMVRILRGRAGIWTAVLLGAVLGASYLTKAVMFPVAFLVIACTGWGRANAQWTNMRRVVCALTFLAISAPQVVAVSREVGRPSFGENGRIAYALYVNHYNEYWLGSPPERGQATHPMKLLLVNPPVFEFASNNASSSYPRWDEPAYWLEGIKPRFSPGQQSMALQREIGTYAEGFAILFVGAVILALMQVSPTRLDFLGISIVAVGVFLLYALVHAEWRFVAAWGVVLFMALTSSRPFRDDASTRAGIKAVLIALTAWHLAVTANGLKIAVVEIAGLAADRAPHEHWMVASAAQQLGLKRGDKVASIGRSSDSYWARLVGAQISLEIPPQVSSYYWTLDEAGRDRVHQLFIDHGATVVVASNPAAGGGPGWVRLGTSAFYGLPLTPLARVGNRR